MTDTPETLKAALADLTARVAAFEKARVEEEKPHAFLTEEQLVDFETHKDLCIYAREAVADIRYLHRELARLREGLRRQEGEMPDRTLSDYMDNPERVPVFGAVTYRSECVRMAREIQRHRKLVAK